MGDEQDEQWNQKRCDESGRPGERGEVPFFVLRSPKGNPVFLSSLVNHVPAVEKHRRLEQSMRNEMEHGQRKGAQAALHDH